MYKIKYTARFIRDIKKLDPHTAKLIAAWMAKNLDGCADPRAHGKSLTGDLREKWRYRVGDYRIIAHIMDKELLILVLAVAHRREVYE
jgi:mRNA interferase RelE/StbE